MTKFSKVKTFYVDDVVNLQSGFSREANGPATASLGGDLSQLFDLILSQSRSVIALL